MGEIKEDVKVQVVAKDDQHFDNWKDTAGRRKSI